MLGTCRLALAMLVALSHIGVLILGFNPGVIAVVGFYLISGYVMTGLVRNHFTQTADIPGFYLDRALRLFPHYTAIAAITLAWFVATGTQTEFLREAPTARRLAENLLVVPINYNMFSDIKDFTLIPPAWSLGAEIQFYLAFPFLLLFNLRRFAILLSLAVYACAAFGVIDTQSFGYRLLPGVLFIFLLGSLLYDVQDRATAQSRDSAILVGITVAAVGAFAALLRYFDKLPLPFNRETLLGLAIGVVLLHLLARRERHPWDEALGALSYGVFLNHFLVKWALFDETVGHNAASVSAFLGVSILLAAVMYRAVEKPALAMRRKLRAEPGGVVADAGLDAGRGGS